MITKKNILFSLLLCSPLFAADLSLTIVDLKQMALQEPFQEIFSTLKKNFTLQTDPTKPDGTPIDITKIKSIQLAQDLDSGEIKLENGTVRWCGHSLEWETKTITLSDLDHCDKNSKKWHPKKFIQFVYVIQELKNTNLSALVRSNKVPLLSEIADFLLEN